MAMPAAVFLRPGAAPLLQAPRLRSESAPSPPRTPAYWASGASNGRAGLQRRVRARPGPGQPMRHPLSILQVPAGDECPGFRHESAAAGAAPPPRAPSRVMCRQWATAAADSAGSPGRRHSAGGPPRLGGPAPARGRAAFKSDGAASLTRSGHGRLMTMPDSRHHGPGVHTVRVAGAPGPTLSGLRPRRASGS